MPPIRTMLRQYVAKRLFGYGPTDDWSYVDKFTGPAKDIKLLGMYSGVAYRCINTIAEAMGDKYMPYLYTQNAQGKKTTVAQHPLLTLLNNPNPDVSFYQLIEGSAAFVEQFGEFFWYMVPGAVTGYGLNGPKQIYLLRPDKVGINLDDKTGEVIGYNLNTGTAGGNIPFQADEIIHHMTFNPKNPYRGFSTVEAAIDYIKTEEEVSRFTRNYFRNNAAMSGVLNVAGKMPRDNWNKFVRQWRERYAGVDNAGKVALVRDSQVSFTAIGSNISDMQLDELKQTTVDQILMMFRIPKGMFGMESDQGLGRASVETLEYIFAKWTLDNKMGRLDDTLQRCMQRYFPNDSAMFVDHENIIPADKEHELNRLNLLLDRTITRAEARSLDPLTANTPVDGDDQLFVLNTQLPLNDPMSSDQAASKPPIAVAPASAPETDEDDDDDESDDGDDDSGSSSAMKPVKVKLVKAKKKDITPESKEQFRHDLLSKADSYVSSYKAAFVGVLEKQKSTVISNMGHLNLGKGIADDLLKPSDEDQNFNEALIPVLTELVKEQGQLALEFSGSTDKYVFSQSVLKAIQDSTKKMSQNFDAETMSQLNDTLAEGVTNGEGTEQLADRVESVYSDATGYRAERVARTESSNASNSATNDAYQQNPAVTAMEWSANPGACDFCADLDGTQVGLQDSFVAQGDSVDVTDDDGNTSSYQADYGDVDNPPLHPNCECTIIPVT